MLETPSSSEIGPKDSGGDHLLLGSQLQGRRATWEGLMEYEISAIASKSDRDTQMDEWLNSPRVAKTTTGCPKEGRRVLFPQTGEACHDNVRDREECKEHP